MSVAVLVYAGMLEIEVGAAMTVLSLTGGEDAVRTTARSRATVVGAAGLVTTPEVMFAALEPPTAVFVPGGPGATRLSKDTMVRHFLASQRARGIPIGASGSGVLALGEAGLLQDRAVSTARELADTVWGYGAAEVREDALTEEDGVITAPGGTGALRVALRIAALTWGEEQAASTARRLGI